MNKESKIRHELANNKWEEMKNSQLISERYPNVLEISIDLKLDYPNAFSDIKKHSTPKYIPTDKAYFEIECPNRECIYSDLSLSYEIRHTVQQKLDLYEGYKICNGYNSFGCSERKCGGCNTRLDYEIRIKYKTA